MALRPLPKPSPPIVTDTDMLGVSLNDESIDLCRKPYNCVPGSDITTKLQSAINDLAAGKISGELYFSKSGTYLINGPQLTGSAYGGAYSGQILLPAIAQATETRVIKIRGTGPAVVGNSNEWNGVILQSNATSGYVMSAIPSGLINTMPFSNVSLILEDLTVSVPFNPQCGGIDASLIQRAIVRRCVIGSPAASSGALTGSKEAIKWPGIANSFLSEFETGGIYGFPVAFLIGDHMMVRGSTLFQACKVGVRGSNAATPIAHFDRLYMIDVPTGLDASGVNQGGQISGIVAWGETTESGLFINDPNNGFSGTIDAVFTDTENHVSSLYHLRTLGDLTSGLKGAPQIGGQFVNVRNILAYNKGWMESNPVDNFLRLRPSLTASGVPGTSSDTNHPWRNVNGITTISQISGATNGSLKASGGNATVTLPVLDARQGAQSRSITSKVTLGTGYDFYLISSRVMNGPLGGNYIAAQLNSGVINLWAYLPGATLLAQATGLGLAVGQVRDLTIALTINASRQISRIRVLLDGVPTTIDVTPTAPQKAAIAPGPTFPYLEDGMLLNETNSTVNAFSVANLND